MIGEVRTLKPGQIVEICGVQVTIAKETEAVASEQDWAVAEIGAWEYDYGVPKAPEPVVEDMPEPTGTVQEQAFRALTD